MDHKFKMRGLRLLEAHFALNTSFAWENVGPIELMHSLDTGYKECNQSLSVYVSVACHDEDLPFRFAVTWEGSFEFEEFPQKDTLDKIANINCAAIIFPYVRETVADMTRRAGIPPFHLNPVNFVEFYNRKKEAAAKTNKRKSKKTAPVKKSRKK